MQLRRSILEDRTITAYSSLTNQSTASQSRAAALEVWGGNRLAGTVPISGAKNAALVILAGTLLCPEACHIRNIPNVVDVRRMGEILAILGASVDMQGNSADVRADQLTTSQAPYGLVSQMRASFFIIGPLLARLGEAKVPLPGGCAIGARPVNFHVRGLQLMGAEVHIEHGMVNAYVKGRSGRLQGAKIYLDYPSVGATETLMMAATLAEGETIIENAALEPEVVDLANFCQAMGAKIQGAGTNVITIEGVPQLHGVDYAVIPDRIEVGTFLVAGAITRSELLIAPAIPDHVGAAIAKLELMGVRVVPEGNGLRVIPGDRLQATDIETMPYPGFPTDMQAQFMTLLCVSEGSSVVDETVFENRMRHVAELERMGADIRIKGNCALVRGVPKLSGAPVIATDLRASAALVLAGLAAAGKTVVRELHHLDRGYERLEEKLRGVGAKVNRIALEPDAGIPPAR